MLTHTTLIVVIVLAALGPIILDVAVFAKRAMVPCRVRAEDRKRRSN
jgi:hypothetical protein